jgi:hypothetical protein
MRTTRRPLTLAALALAASAALTLSACRTSVSANVDTTGITQDVAVAADTGAAHPSSHSAAAPATPQGPAAGATTPDDPTPDDTTGDAGATDDGGAADGQDLPEPGYGVSGDEGLCQAEAGWYGYAGLALVGASADDQVWPDEVVPVLEQLRDAPTAHEDASADLVDAASDLSYATDEVITEITAGADAAQAMAELDDPFTTFANGCLAEGIQV